MPLHLHTSNRTENLAQRLVDVASQDALSSALAPETVMTLNPGMARWLRFEIARRTGVSFGWDFPLPGKLFKQLLLGFEPNFDSAGAFSENLALWRLSEVLANLEDHPRFTQVRAYCQSGSASRRLDFASRLTRLYDEYLVYRPDVVVGWEDDPKGYDWQAEIWRRLLRSLFPSSRQPRHIARIWDDLRRGNILELGMQMQRWPERLFIFGVSSLAPLYLDLLDTIARYRPVHIFLLQPSDLYWADLKTTKDSQKIAKRIARKNPSQDMRPEDWLFETGNPLLPSFGKQSQMFLDLLIDKNALQDDGGFEPPQESSQLGALQSDLFTITSRNTETGDAPFPPYDGTIQIHSCAARRREVETVWDFIVSRLDQNRSLAPSAILVMAPDIQKYRSHIEAVFAAKRGTDLEIPFTIADASASSRSGVFSGLSALLKTSSTRAAASDILALIESPLLRQAFHFSDQDLERIEYWIRELGITWGWGAAHREQHNGFPTDRNTWRELRIRLASGLAFSSSYDATAGFAAYPELEGELSDTAGRFLECLELLRSLHQSSRQTHSLNTWQERLLALVANLRTPHDDWQTDFQKAIELVCESLPNLTDVLATGAEAYRAVQEKLEASPSGGGYLSGGVTFCSLKPMRAIPADTICLLGMNRLDFPRRSTRLSFDLLASTSRIGDRNTRDEDRQFFLETLLSARSHLFISYQGTASDSDAKKEPSVVVEELLAFLERAMSAQDFAAMIHQQKRQAFDPAYFEDEGRSTYDPERAALHNRFFVPTLSSENEATIPARDDRISAQEPPSSIELEDLIRFFRDPAKAFTHGAAKLRLIADEEPLPPTDPLRQGGLDRYHVRQALAEAIAIGDPVDTLSSKQFASSKVLPPGVLETLVFQEEQERAAAIENALGPDRVKSAYAEVQLNDIAVSGDISIRPSDKRQILVHGGDLKSPRLIESWIRHLFALCSIPEFSGETWAITLHQGEKHLKFGPVDEARAFLEQLVELYLHGQEQPLSLFPILSQQCFQSWQKDDIPDEDLRKQNALEVARKALANSKTDSEFFRHFDWSLFDRTCFGDSFELDETFVDLACSFWKPINAASEPLLLSSSASLSR